MSAWWLLLAGVLIGVGICVLLAFVSAAWISRPDSRERDAYDELAVANAAGVVPPDGSHDDLTDVDTATVAGWMVELYGMWPGAAMYDADPTVPPIVPGREFDWCARPEHPHNP
jgi:hypothetical protein